MTPLRKLLRQHKYRAKPTVIDGHRFPSRREARRYGELKLLERAGLISQLELQPRFPITVGGIKVCTYVGDFMYANSKGERVIEDVKGMRTPMYKLKKKLLEATYGIRIQEV